MILLLIEDNLKLGDITLVFFGYTTDGSRNWLVKTKFTKATIDKIDFMLQNSMIQQMSII
ncbi:hypothetical protein [Miniphocaeibacter halophilus]|uniref:Uncharacterized protein n=1 Tax=Miniphocaeibacter halophilus TaxID=2931922 RepID=A0AC61MPC0_9FIRM|nr:hypothetical protein [Miniphocaeibacter halophilus]QQK07372.1 hypothetical protein JFY71_08610 [Miniphocaeibacter halophilus]